MSVDNGTDDNLGNVWMQAISGEGEGMFVTLLLLAVFEEVLQ